jgi:hypothetical protein
MTENESQEPEQPEVEQPEEQAEPEQQPTRQERRDEHVRTRLKEVEAERDGLQARLDARDRASVEAEARRVLGERGQHLARLDQLDLAEVRDPESGDLDPERVAALLRPVREALDETTAHHGDMGPRKSTKPKQGPSWGDVVSGRR